MPIRLAHSPDADDAFMFYALAKGKVSSRGLDLEHVLSDIETLNRRAREGAYELTALSFHAYAYVQDQYRLISVGASMGDGYGPRVVAKTAAPLEAFAGKRIAVPGLWTSAILLLRFYLPKFEPVVVPFDRIPQAVLEGRADAGLLIHEGQLNYADLGLTRIADMGELWKQETGLPAPLGGNGIRRDVPGDLADTLQGVLADSIAYALAHRAEALAHARPYARGLDPARVDQFVGMYVNELTVDLGGRGRRALELFFERAHRGGWIPSRVIPFPA